MFQMHEKAQETEECEEVFLAAAKKFRHSKKVTEMFTLLIGGAAAEMRQGVREPLPFSVSYRAGVLTNGHDQS